jgi:hypothetical protein
MVRHLEVRVAAVDDAPAMGLAMVESFLDAHRGQLPEAAHQKRADEWTPEVSAAGWARALTTLATLLSSTGPNAVIVTRSGMSVPWPPSV